MFFAIFFSPPARKLEKKNLRLKNYFYNFFLIYKSLRRRGLNSKHVNPWKKEIFTLVEENLEFDLSRWPQNDGNLLYLRTTANDIQMTRTATNDIQMTRTEPFDSVECHS